MPGHDLARRTLLRSSLLLAPGVPEALAQAMQHAHSGAAESELRLTFLKATEAAEIEALAAEIIPTDDTPGAKGAGVIFFIDRALATFDQDKRDLYRSGLADAQGKRRSLFPGSASITGLTPAQRIELMKAIEKTEFFEALRVHTITGFLAEPSWGGNRNKAGWKLIGFEDKWVWQPPFGYYDSPEDAR